MSLISTNLEREFTFKGNKRPDPDPAMSADNVLSFYSATYPELTTSNVIGHKIENDKLIYEFKPVIGTKG